MGSPSLPATSPQKLDSCFSSLDSILTGDNLDFMSTTTKSTNQNCLAITRKYNEQVAYCIPVLNKVLNGPL